MRIGSGSFVSIAELGLLIVSPEARAEKIQS